MAPSRRTWFDERGLTLAAAAAEPGDAAVEAAPGARRLDLFLGAFHYWRAEPARWKPCLAALERLGLTAVETHVPWRIHEPAAGRFAWSDERDLRRFVELAGDAGLAVLLRLGPVANAELPGFGLPDDLLHDPAVLARTAHGSPAWLPAPPRTVPVLSLAAEALHVRVRAWFAAVAAQVAPLLAPRGPLAALALDLEPGLYRHGAYDLDYHPEALARWAALHPQWPEPPRAWAEADAARCLAWVRFKRQLAADAARRTAAALDDVGFAGLARLFPAPLAHAAPVGHAGATTPTGLHPGLPAARDLPAPLALTSHGPASAAAIRRAALRATGELTPLPIALESGCGEAAWMPPAGGADADRRRALTLLAAGARGLGFSMAVERPNWSGGLLEPDGALAADAGWAPRLLAALRAVEWTALRRRPAIAVVTSAADADHALAAAALDPVAPVAAGLLGLPAEALALPAAATTATTARRWQHAVEQALERAGVAYEFLDERATADELAGYRAVIAPLGERVSRGLYRTLRDLAADQRAIVVLGPAPPTLDEDGRPLDEPPLRRAGKMRPGSLEDLEGLAADLAQLSSEPALWRCPTEHAVLSLAADAGGRARVLFVHNDGPAATVELATAEPRVRAVRDPLSDEVFALAPTARVPMAAGDVRMLIIERP